MTDFLYFVMMYKLKSVSVYSVWIVDTLLVLLEHSSISRSLRYATVCLTVFAMHQCNVVYFSSAKQCGDILDVYCLEKFL